MFVQTHFQRARHQATGANSSPHAAVPLTGHQDHPSQAHSHSSAARHNHNHNHHHHHHHRSSSHTHKHTHRDQGNHANHGHNQQQHCERSAQFARATTSQRAQTIKSGAREIKGKEEEEEDEQLVRGDRLLATGGENQIFLKHHPNHNHPYYQRDTSHAHLGGTVELECNDERRENHHEKVEGYYHSHRQLQMGPLKADGRTQTTCTIGTTTGRGGDSLPRTGALPAASNNKNENSTTLRLRSASLSKLGPSHLHDINASNNPLNGIESDGDSKNHPAAHSSRVNFNRLSRSQARRRNNSREPRLNRGNRRTGNFEHQLERVLTALVGPSVIVGRSLTNKIFTSDQDKSQFEQDQHKASSSHLKLGALLTPVAQTLHCLALFILNFLQFQWHTLRHFVTCRLSIGEKFKSADNCLRPVGANSVLEMRAQRRQRPRMAAGAGAYSFDASRRVLAPHEFTPAVAPYHHHHHHHQQQQQQSPPVWMNALIEQPASIAAGHAHQHNHAHGHGHLYGTGYRGTEMLLSAHQVHEPPLAHQINRYRSLDCDAQESSHGRYTDFAVHQPALAQPLMFADEPQQQQHHHHQVMPPMRRNVSADASQMWKWHARHTVDGVHLPNNEQVLGAYSAPLGGSFDHQAAHYLPPNASHHAHGCQAQLGAPRHAPHLAGLPHRHHLTSISSPTLSEHDSMDCWPATGEFTANIHAEPLAAADLYQPSYRVGGGGGMSQPTMVARSPQHVHAHPRRQLPQPPTREPPAHPGSLNFALNSNAKFPNRRLSSIIGSDSELYTARRDQPATSVANSSDASSVSSASRSRANANLARFQLGKQSGYARQDNRPAAQPQKRQPASTSQAVVNVATDRRRFARQASSTSAASQSCATTASVQHAGASARRVSGTGKLPHQFNSLQADSRAGQTTAVETAATASSPSKAPNRLSKSDTESRTPANEAQAALPTAKAKARPAPATGSGETSGHQRPTSAKTTLNTKSLAASGKSKSVVSAHPSPIGVLGKAVSLAGAKRRLGFKQKGGLSSLSVHRSEEYFPAASRRADALGGSGATTASNSLNSDSCEVADPSSSSSASRWLSQFSAGSSPDPRVCFVEGLGAGQIASRQALVSPYLGDIQVSLSDRRGMLEVEIIRVRQLQPKPGAKRLPSPYVKVYLMRNKKCAAKFKTAPARQTLDPLYQQLFIFRDDYSNCVLQIIVWADYGKKDRKSLMGIVQIHLNDLDMSQVVIGWYKLFNAPSMVAATASSPSVANSSKALRQTLSSTKLGDLATIQRQQQQQQVADFLAQPAVAAVASAESQQQQQQQQQQQVNTPS